MVSRPKLGKVFRSEGLRHTLVQHGLNRPSTFVRSFRLSEAVVLAYNSGLTRLTRARMRRIRQSNSSEKTALSWILPARCKTWAVCLYLWPEALTTSDGARVAWSCIRRSMVSLSTFPIP